MDYKNKKIGVWGFGITGKAAIRFLYAQGAQLSILDQKTFTAEELSLLERHQVRIYTPEQQTLFLQEHDYILASPGIDTRAHYNQYQEKWITELDLFFDHWHKPIIAITGTVGKTTVTSFLSQLMQSAGLRVATGGNIGVATFDLIESPTFGIKPHAGTPCENENNVSAKGLEFSEEATVSTAMDLCLLETADVQLRYTRQFAPDLAIWTNFSANHLDWHDSLASYFRAKCNIIAHQKAGQEALVPLELYAEIIKTINPASIIHLFTPQKPNAATLAILDPKQALFYIDGDFIAVYQQGKWQNLIACNLLPSITYESNWLVIIAALHLQKISIATIIPFLTSLALPAHRLEKLTTIDGVDFYNDAKSTAPAATLAAVQKLKSRPIVLLLGGLSKNVDRKLLIQELANSNIKAVFCFGAEAASLSTMAIEQQLLATAHATLQNALEEAVKTASPGDQILFSPAGSSFDLFSNYEQRGRCFVALVEQLQQKDRLRCQDNDSI